MMNNQGRAEQLEQKTIEFSIALITQLRIYLKDESLQPLVNQVIRSSTSIGANYAEANNASSPMDFKNKIYIARKEAAETTYWLKVLARLLPEEDFSGLQQQATEL